MKLGTETGSLTNHLYSRMTIGAPEPEVGMAATVLAWSDRYAATVTGIGNIVYVRTDTVTCRPGGGGYMGHQDWQTEPNPNGSLYTFRRNKQGGWDEVRLNGATNRWVKANGCGLILGRRDHYRDWSF